MEFHGIHGSPWNPMEFHGVQGIPKFMDIDESLTVYGMSSGVEVKCNYPGIVWLRKFKKTTKKHAKLITVGQPASKSRVQ